MTTPLLMDTLIPVHSTDSGISAVNDSSNTIWFAKSMFCVGLGDGKLTREGLQERLLTMLKGKEEDVFKTDEFTQDGMVAEERNYVLSLQQGKSKEFDLDTTMTVMAYSDADSSGGTSIVLHSPTPLHEGNFSLLDEVCQKGTVRHIVAANLQHWLFIPQWVKALQRKQSMDITITVWTCPSACGESVKDKLTPLLTEESGATVSIQPLFGPDDADNSSDILELVPGVRYALLRGAELMLNEVVFHHEQTQTLVVCDSFYTGYDPTDPPGPFGRVWFKLTKAHWSSVELPIYRTIRVATDGNYDVLSSCIKSLTEKMPFRQILCAHGNRLPFRGDNERSAQDWWEYAWTKVLSHNQ